MSERCYKIKGGSKLNGTISVSGAKNAISKQLVASLLTGDSCTFTNVPDIVEIKTVLGMLAEIGAEYSWSDRRLIIKTSKIANAGISQKFAKYNRIPILFIGPLLHRAGEAEVPIMGGCRIGSRPIDFHIEVLKTLGAEVEVTENSYKVRADRLKGASISLNYPSVGATENAIISSVLAEGTTVISNAAIEPEIIDTILFLQKMGAHIMVDVDRRIVIEGVKSLRGATHRTLPDRIEVASFAVAAVATDGEIEIENARQEDLVTFLNVLRQVGGGFKVKDSGITFFRERALSSVHVETDVHPGFMTDWQQPFVVMLTQASGTSVVHETVYEKRFGYTETLNEMGADIELLNTCLGSKTCRFRDRDYKHSAIVRGPTRLKASRIEIPDLRAGFAHVIAALMAEGTSEIHGIEYLERGYANVPEKLKAIGVSIET